MEAEEGRAAAEAAERRQQIESGKPIVDVDKETGVMRTQQGKEWKAATHHEDEKCRRRTHKRALDALTTLIENDKREQQQQHQQQQGERMDVDGEEGRAAATGTDSCFFTFPLRPTEFREPDLLACVVNRLQTLKLVVSKK